MKSQLSRQKKEAMYFHTLLAVMKGMGEGECESVVYFKRIKASAENK